MTQLFEALDLSRRGFPRKLIGSEHGELLIVGTGRCLWEDVRGLPEFSHVMAVNDVGMHWPGQLRHWYSSDVEQLVAWHDGRRRPYKNIWGTAALHSSDERAGVHHWPFPSQGGSGLVAILVGLALGYEHIVLAGMPFDDSGHYYDPPAGHNLKKDRKWSNFTTETPDHLMKKYLPIFKGRVRALSGRMRDYLG